MRKKRILFCGEATYLNTGYATYLREIMKRLHATGKYELAEFASYGSDSDPKRADIPWHFFGNLFSYPSRFTNTVRLSGKNVRSILFSWNITKFDIGKLRPNRIE